MFRPGAVRQPPELVYNLSIVIISSPHYILKRKYWLATYLEIKYAFILTL